VRVISRLGLSPLLSLDCPQHIAGFQEALRERYPLLAVDERPAAVLGARGIAGRPSVIWRFLDLVGSWRVSLARDFVAVETSSYRSRVEFLGRMREVLSALEEHVRPGYVGFVGLRYIDRVSGPWLGDIEELIRPELLSGLRKTSLGEHLHHQMSQASFRLPDSRRLLTLRWGEVPENATPDPEALEPIEERSRVLDLDIVSAGLRTFDVDSQVALLEELAARIYAVFRWAVSDEFLRRCGGDPAARE
jgi:uncharacterized protein (TIGR04255 family)